MLNNEPPDTTRPACLNNSFESLLLSPSPTPEDAHHEEEAREARNAAASASDDKADNEAATTLFDPVAFQALLQRECRLWQRKLGLSDWTVRVSLVRLSDMPDADAIGAIMPMLERKDAHMLLLSPMDIPLLAGHFLSEKDVHYDMTIVHELLHLHLAPVVPAPTDEQVVAEEQAINAITRCIVNAHLKLKKPVSAPAHTPGTVGHYL